MSGFLPALRRISAVALVIGLVTVGAACGSDGDDLDEFQTGAVTTTITP